MTKFTQLAPATSISAQQLDENFRKVAPAENQDLRQVRLLRGQDGWKIEVFPEFPFETAMLASSGDMPFWLSVSELLNELVNAGLGPGAAGGIPEPPAGTAGWREVERCDGKTMYVWGTEWAD